MQAPFLYSYMHIDLLAIASASRYRCSHHNQLVIIDKVSDTSFVLCAVAGLSDEIELERGRKRGKDSEKKDGGG